MRFSVSFDRCHSTITGSGQFPLIFVGMIAFVLLCFGGVDVKAQTIHGTVVSVSADTVRVELADSVSVPDDSEGRIVQDRTVGGRTVEMTFAVVSVDHVEDSEDAPWVAVCKIERRSRDITVGHGVHFEQAEPRSTLVVQTEPAGASVDVEERSLGRTPVRRGLRSGTYTLRLEREGYFTETRTVSVSPGEERVVDVSLRRSEGTLIVNTLPNDARVFLRETEIGRTPIDTTVQTGSDTLTIRREGYLPVVRKVEIRQNEETRLNVTLRRPLSVRLAKKHGEAVENATLRRDGDRLVVKYDLVGGSEKYTVDLLLSTDGGQTFDALPETTQGEVGEDITPGSGKRILWAALEDFPKGFQDEGYRLRVATDPQGGRGILWVIGSAVVAGGGATAAALLGAFGDGGGSGEGSLPDAPPAPPQ